jgi:hypothetical protein
MIDNLINPIATEIKAAVQLALGTQLGQYRRPNLPNIPAIWLGRNIPANCKVITAPPKDPPVPALEVIVDLFPEYAVIPSNFKSKALSEMWRIWLIFHDDRQFPREAIRSIITNFQIVDSPAHLPAADPNPNQYQILITYNNRLAT